MNAPTPAVMANKPVTMTPIPTTDEKKTGCNKCPQIEDRLRNLEDFLDEIRHHVTQTGNTMGALTRQANAVAENQKWMSQTVKDTVENLPNLIAGAVPGGGMMTKLLGMGKSDG